jgi:WD40 repeat protein
MNGSAPHEESAASVASVPITPLPSQPTPIIPDHELLKKIGDGSYGEVWLARNAVGTLRAVKIVWRKTFWQARPFEREFKGIQKFEPISREHEGLVDVLQIGRGEGYFYYVMELADDDTEPITGVLQCGSDSKRTHPNTLQHSTTPSPRHSSFYSPHSLQSELTRRGRLPPAECVRIGLMLTSALEHLHRYKLVHRDVKPANIIFVGGVPKLADIGLVAEVSEARSYVGTEGFIPPEGPGTVQADLYSLGKLLYELSTGKDRHAFPELPGDLPEQSEVQQLVELNTVLLKACQPNPRARYQTAEAMHADLLMLQHGRSVRRLRLIERRVTLLTRTTLVASLLLAIASAAYLVARLQARREATQRQASEQLLYAADVNLAQQALEAGNLVRATTLLEAHRPGSNSKLETPNSKVERDLRGFEWYYLRNRCRGDEVYTFRGHEQAVQGVAISPDGKLLASCSDDNTVKLWELAAKTNLATLAVHAGAVNALTFSPNGAKMASGGADKTVRLWDVATREVVARLTNHTTALTSLAFTPDGRLLAVGTESSGAKLWDLTSRQVVHEFTASDGPANLVAVSPDGQCLAIGGEGPGVRLWNLSTFQPLAELFDQRGTTFGMAFSPDGKFLAATRSDGVVLWDIAGRRVVRKLRGHEREVHAVVFSPDGKIVASGSEDMTIRLWDLESGQLVRILKGHNKGIYSLAFSSDGQQLISGSLDHTLKLWDLLPKEEPNVLRGHADAVNSVAFSPDDQMLASGGLEGTVKLWDVSSGTNLATLTGHTAGVTGVEFSSDGATIFSCGLDKTIRFWDVATREQRAELLAEERLACLALSPDGRTLASGSGWWDQPGAPCVVTFWDVASRRRLTRYVGVPGLIRTLRFSPDGKTLAIGRTDEDSVELLDMASKHPVFLSTNLGAELAWSPDNRTLAASELADLDFIGSLDIRTTRIVPRFQVPGGGARSLTLSPDGKTLAVFGVTANIDLCNVVTGRKVATLRGHETFGFGLTFSHDGQTLASASNDRTIRLWRGPTNDAELAGRAAVRAR